MPEILFLFDTMTSLLRMDPLSFATAAVTSTVTTAMVIASKICV